MTKEEREHRLELLRRAVDERSYLFNKSDVLGYAVGFRHKDGEWTDEPVLVVHVKKGRKEKDPSDFPRHQRIPRRIRLDVEGETEWLGVDLVESEVGELCDNADIARRHDVGIGNRFSTDTTGTIGWIARRKENGEPVVCSALHVLLRFGESDFERDGPRLIYDHTDADSEEYATSPSIEDGGDINGDLLGTIRRGLRSQLGDVAISSVQTEERLADVRDAIGPIGPVRLLQSTELDPSAPIRVRMRGRTSGEVSGTILEYPAHHPFEYPDRSRPLRLVDMIATDIRTQRGDSGALLVDEDQRPMGTLIGRANGRSYFMNIEHIVASMRLKEFSEEA